MTIKINKKQIIVGLDCDTEEEVEAILTLLDPNLYRVKVGKQLFMNCGPNIIEKINNFGFEIFLDLKLHDIPNTVSKALQNILKLNIWMTNIHLSGGREMIEASVNKIKEFKDEDPKEGDSISAQITSIDRKERFINLSVRALEKSEEKSLLKENIKKNKEIEESTKTSIGDLIKDEIGESSSDEDEKV